VGKEVTLAIDCMGGDHGPSVTVPAALRFLERDPSATIHLVGRHDAIEAQLRRRKATAGERLRVRHAAEVVAMDESPAAAVKRKKDSSMRVAIDLVKNGDAQACVSAATPALMATRL
jgi:glycerol-3-phosphate acyltransferase PlsX